MITSTRIDSKLSRNAPRPIRTVTTSEMKNAKPNRRAWRHLGVAPLPDLITHLALPVG